MTQTSTTPKHERPGDWMHALATDLYPLHRSMTGEGVRSTLERLARHLPIEVREVPSGTEVLDWVIPDEWNVSDAYIADAGGERLVDLGSSTLHLASYSQPIHVRLSWEDLRPHLFALPDHPDWIPYRTLHGREGWEFCLTQRELDALEARASRDPGSLYEVRIDGRLAAGHLSYGEVHLPGRSREEILVSTHVCHPALANDNLSGIAVATRLAMELAQVDHHHSYRFLFVPATIGPIAWLAHNECRLGGIRHGLVLAGLGDRGPITYKRSRRSDLEIDRMAAVVLRDARSGGEVVDFEPWGYDERQYGSPGFDLPMGRMTRTPPGTYPEYHTSGDDLSFIDAASLEDSFGRCLEILEGLENNRRYLNLAPKGEPRLGRRGLYEGFEPGKKTAAMQHAVQWVLNQSDGEHSLLDIAERSGMPFATLDAAAQALLACDLLEPLAGPSLPSGATAPGSGQRRAPVVSFDRGTAEISSKSSEDSP